MSEEKMPSEEYLVIVERINLRYNLERIMIPATIACWLARRWPEWALPAVLWVRLNESLVDGLNFSGALWKMMKGLTKHE